MRLMEDYRPDFCYSLHNASFCGVYFYASRCLPALFGQLHRLVAAQGLELHQGEAEVPLYPALGSGRVSVFQRPRQLRLYGEKPRRAIRPSIF